MVVVVVVVLMFMTKKTAEKQGLNFCIDRYCPKLDVLEKTEQVRCHSAIMIQGVHILRTKTEKLLFHPPFL